MSEPEKIKIESYITKARNILLGFVLTCATTFVAFYFNTKNTVINHEKRIERLETAKADKTILETELKWMRLEFSHTREDIQEIKQDIKTLTARE